MVESLFTVFSVFAKLSICDYPPCVGALTSFTIFIQYPLTKAWFLAFFAFEHTLSKTKITVGCSLFCTFKSSKTCERPLCKITSTTNFSENLYFFEKLTTQVLRLSIEIVGGDKRKPSLVPGVKKLVDLLEEISFHAKKVMTGTVFLISEKLQNSE